MSAVAKWGSVTNGVFRKSAVHVAAVNDCTAAEYHYRYQSHFGSLKTLFKAVIDYLRSRWIGVIEAKMLQSYDAILLQTARDKELMKELVHPTIAAKVVLAPNGVNHRFRSVSNENGRNIVFVGELSGEYGEIISWLVSEVWPGVVDRCPNSNLRIVGKGASSTLAANIRSTQGVENIEYVEDLSDVYKDAIIAISPVFKGFGLINKTVEAMACGVAVVGGAAAFNGIPGFESNVHGAVCLKKSKDEFVNMITYLIENEDKRKDIGRAGKKLIAGGFNWDTTNKIIQGVLSAGSPA
ncbi:MAG: glycosyltransferase [Rhodoferax sp.]|nr:glycosyltransferase [Rhodoferax sp.]